jgi:protein-disulfide isomerase|tara:strand:- start:4598 stop:5326 length:729 start_codon:yes stop_codon:yes gene_type:complete
MTMRIRRFFLNTCVVAAFGIGPAFAEPVEQEDVFGEKVRHYLMTHPEVILEVMDILAARQSELATKVLLEPHVAALFETELDLRVGPTDAEHVIVEFFDYNCAVCKANVPVMQAFVAETPNVAIVKKHLPILSPSSERAVRFVLAARTIYGDAAHSELHSAIYAKIGPLTLTRLSQIAHDLGFEPEAIEPRMQDAEITDVIDQHRDIAMALKILGTPTFVTRDKMHVGAVTPEILTRMVGGA